LVNYNNEYGCSAWQQTMLVVTVLSVPVNLTVQNLTIADGQTRCFDATQTITVAGSGTTFLVQSGGSATFIAGQNILYLPGTKVEAGGYMHGYIAPGGPWCGLQPQTIPNTEIQFAVDDLRFTTDLNKEGFRVYPNPTDGKFTVEYMGEGKPGRIRVEIYGMKGDRILTESFFGERKHEFTLDGQTIGIYLIRIVTDGSMSTVRILKR